jgi:hypothetical protein
LIPGFNFRLSRFLFNFQDEVESRKLKELVLANLWRIGRSPGARGETHPTREADSPTEVCSGQIILVAILDRGCRYCLCGFAAEAHIKIARMTVTVKRDRNWSMAAAERQPSGAAPSGSRVAMASSSSAPPVAACASTPGGGALTVASYNIGANVDAMFSGPSGKLFKDKVISDMHELMKVLAF